MSTEIDDEAEEAQYQAELAYVEKLFAEGIEPFERFLSEGDLRVVREEVVGVLMTHPVFMRYLAEIVKRPAVDHSGEVGGEPGEDDAAKGRSGAG